jgi:hypothetical protein
MVKQDAGAAEGWAVRETIESITVHAWWRLTGVSVADRPQPPSAPERR